MVRYSTINENEINSEVVVTTGNVGASDTTFATTAGGDQTPPMAEPASGDVTNATSGDAEFVYRDFSNSEKVTTSDFKDALAKAGEDISLAPANLAISSLFNTASMGQDVGVWATEKVAHGAGWVSEKLRFDELGNTLSNFSPYSFYKENPDKYRAQKATAEEFSRTVFDSDSYSRHKVEYDIAGELVAGDAVLRTASIATKVGSPVYRALTSAGVPSRMVNKVFWNPETAAREMRSLKAAANNLAKLGINPGAVRSVGDAAWQVVKKAAPETFKKSLYSSTALGTALELNPNIPEHGFVEKLIYYGAIPQILETGIPALGKLFQTRQIFSRAARKADTQLASDVSKYLLDNGLDDIVLKEAPVLHGNILTNYGLAGNPASEVATTSGYIVKALKQAKQDALAKVESGKAFGVTRQEVIQGFDNLISGADAQRTTAISELIDKTASAETRAFLTNTAKTAQENFSNITVGTNKISLAPNTNNGLSEITNNLYEKRKELARLAESTKAKPENRVKYIEKLKENLAVNYQLIDDQGKVYDMGDIHLRWRDSANLSKAIKETNEGIVENSGVKTPMYSTELVDDEFASGARFKIGSSSRGDIKIMHQFDGKWLTPRPVNYTQTGAFDPSWVLLGKQLNYLSNPATSGNTKFKRGLDKLIATGTRYNIDPLNAGPQQIAYWREALQRFGEEDFSKVFKISDQSLDTLAARASRAYGVDASQLSLGDMLWYGQVANSRALMRARAVANASKADKFKFNQFTEDSLFSELTGLKGKDNVNGLANETVVNDFLAADEKQMLKLVEDSKEFSRKPQKYALQELTEESDLTDRINNQLFANAAERTVTKQLILTGEASTEMASEFGDTIVSQVAKAAYSQPQLANGYLDSPNSVGFQSTSLLGRLFRPQEQRHGNNVTLAASVAFNNEMSPQINKIVNDAIRPLSEATKAMLNDDAAMLEYGKYAAQLRGGYRLADDFLEEDGGMFRVKLDNEKLAINKKVNDKLSIFSRTDGTSAIEEGYLPDPLTGEPLLVSAKTAKQLLEQHLYNKKIHLGMSQINKVLGQEDGPFMNGHVPSFNFANYNSIKVVGIDDGHNHFEPLLYTGGNTNKEAMRMAQTEIVNSGRKDLVIKDPEAIGLYKQIIQADVEQNYFPFSDYNDLITQAITKGGDGTRSSQGSIIRYGQDFMKEILEANNRQAQQLAARTRLAIFSDQIDQARSLLAGRGKGSYGSAELGEYIKNLTGRAVKLGDSGSAVEDKLGWLYNAADGLVDAGASAIAAFRNSWNLVKEKQFKEYQSGTYRNTSKFFNKAGEVEEVYKLDPDGLGLGGALSEAMRLLKVHNPKLSRELVGNINRMATNNLLRLGNAGYAMANIHSLPVMMTLVRNAMRRLPGEDVAEFQAKLGSYGKIVGKGENFAIDPIGGFGETISWIYKNPDEAKEAIRLATEKGYFDMKANALADAFINPADIITSPGAKQAMKWLTAMGDKSEEVSRYMPYLMGYRMAKLSGYDTASAISMGRKAMVDTVGNFVASNRPLVFSGKTIGPATGLFQTYAINAIEQFGNKFISGDISTAVKTLAAQIYLYGIKSVDKANLVEKYLAPVDPKKDYSKSPDLYSKARIAGMSDYGAKSLLYGAYSATTGLDFSAKGDINAIAVPGTTDPASLNMFQDTAEGAWEIAKQIGSDTDTDPNTIWEILQTRLPSTIGRQAISAKLGYKVDRNHNKIIGKADVGNALWWTSLVLSMNTLDERMSRDAVLRKANWERARQESNSLIRNNAVAEARNSDNLGKTMATVIKDSVANGADPSQIGRILKDTLVKAFTNKYQQQQFNKKTAMPFSGVGSLDSAARLAADTIRSVDNRPANNEPVLPVDSDIGEAIASQPESRYHIPR